jgi:hypothetical protein
MDRLGELGRAYLPETEIALLDGRLAVRMPAAAAVQPVGASLMGAPASTETQTRVVLDVGDERLVMMATELFQHSPSGFRETVDTITAHWQLPAGTRLQVLPVPFATPTGLEGLAVARAPLDRTRQAVPVMDAFVRHADTTVQQLTCYVSPNAADDTEGCGFLAFRIFGTLTAGQRALVSNAGPRELPDITGQPAATVTVPPGWVLSTRRGASFAVHTLTRVMPFGGRFGSVTVYLGGHPSPLHQQAAPGTVATRPGGLAGQATTWYFIRSTEDGQPPLLRREALVNLGQVMLHAFSATDEPGLEGEIEAIMGAIQPTR